MKTKKIVTQLSSGALCLSLIAGNGLPVMAATIETQEATGNTTQDTNVLYEVGASYFVTIPKTITLGNDKTSNYSVKVQGDIPSDKEVYVSPIDSVTTEEGFNFYMHDQSTKNTKADVVATVTHNKDIWDFEDAASGYEETNNTISASNLTAGNWKGTFTFNINLRDVTNGGGTIDEDTYGEDVTLTSSNLATYGIANTGDVTIPSVVTDSEGVKHKVTTIGACAFLNCTGLTTITIPESVTSIGSDAFCGCSGLTSITIPESVTSIGINAFAGCSGLTSITIPESVTSIGGGAFSGCKLTSITIPESVTSIGDATFSGCSGLTSITIPESVTSIGNSAFSGCSKLTSITIPESVTSIGERAFRGSGLTSITIPESVTSIGGGAFYNCSKLTSITIPESVTSIGDRAFYGCSKLTSITIPDSVTSIGNEAFINCSSLTTVNYTGTEEQWNAITIYGSNNKLTNATINYNYVAE